MGPIIPKCNPSSTMPSASLTETGTIAGITAGTRADAEAQIKRGATMILAAAQSLVLAGSNSFLPEK